MGEIVRAEGVTKEYRMGRATVAVLNGVDICVDEGEIVAIMGRSGSGKSTLFNLLGALDVPTSGSIRVAGRELSGLTEPQRARYPRTGVGFVFQSFNLLAALSARQNVELPLLFAGVQPKSRERRATHMLERLGLEHRADHLPSELSGGEQQRVAIARALVTDPSLLLADEPTGNLDYANGAATLELIEELSRERNVTVLMTTHDADVAARAHRIIRIHDGAVHTGGAR